MYLLIAGLIVIGVVLLLAVVLAVFVFKSKGTTYITHPDDQGDVDYDGLEDKEFLCRNCGDVVDPFDEECPNCGSELETEFECQYCGELVEDPRELVCPACGEALMDEVTVCPSCTSIVPNNANHCEVCGDDFWSPLYLSPRKVPKFVPPDEPEEQEEEAEGEEETEAEEDY